MEGLIHLSIPVGLVAYFGLFTLSVGHLRLRVLKLSDPYYGYIDEGFAEMFVSEVKEGKLAGLWGLGVSRDASPWLHGQEDTTAMDIERRYHQDKDNDELVDEMDDVVALYGTGIYRVG